MEVGGVQHRKVALGTNKVKLCSSCVELDGVCGGHFLGIEGEIEAKIGFVKIDSLDLVG